MNPNYRTLHRDIGLIQRTNNGWDLWFDNGDTVRAEDFHSLQVGIIIACLTSWNYMNRYGNPTYSVFGNKSYTLLKQNKSQMVAYKIEQYFLECLKRMRRVYDVVSITVSEVPYDPYKYVVEFEVMSINNQLVDGSFTISTEATKSASYIDYDLYMPYASNKTPLQMDVWLRNEYGGGISGEILYMYVQEGNSEPVMKVVGETDSLGYLRVMYEPTGASTENNIHFIFRGNTTYNGVVSQYKTFETEQLEYEVEFMDEDIVNAPRFVDLHINVRARSLITGNHRGIMNEEIIVTGSDGSFYTATTDAFGDATVRVKVTEHTIYTVYYGDVTDTISVMIPKITPVLELSKRRISPYLVGLQALLFDEDGNPITDKLDGLKITFKRMNNEIIADNIPVKVLVDTAMAGTNVYNDYNPTQFIAELNGNDYYNSANGTYEE